MKSENGMVYIVGAGSVCPDDFRFQKRDEDLLIAADAGFLALKNAGILPDILVADFDSMPEPLFSGRLIRLPVVKDDTDTVYAVKEGLRLGYRKFVIIGGLGGSRFSHSLANVQVLSYLKANGAEGELCFGKTKVRLITEGERIRFEVEECGTVSLFSYTERAVVSIHGLQYEGERIELSSEFPLGVSNHLAGRAGEVTVHQGKVLIVTET